MATKAKTTTKSKSASARKTTSRAATSARVVTNNNTGSRLDVVSPNALVGEAVGTFGLALAALTAPADQPLLVGLTLAILLVGLMRVSGGNFNPAVTFGLWAANKLEGIKVPFYWVAQFIGALAALLVVGQFNGQGSALDLSTFGTWDWRTFWVEAVGTALFLMGVVAVLKNVTSVHGRALGVGLSLTIGLVVAGGLLTANATREQTVYQEAAQSGKAHSFTRTFAAQGPALNPAIALAQTERDVDAINKSIDPNGGGNVTQKKPSHFTVSVVLGSLLGAAVGANLYMLVAGMPWKKREF